MLIPNTFIRSSLLARLQRNCVKFMEKNRNFILCGNSDRKCKRTRAGNSKDFDFQNTKKMKSDETVGMADINSLKDKYNFTIETQPTQSESDTKEYLAIRLGNGLRALLISDVRNLIDLEHETNVFDAHIILSDDEDDDGVASNDESCSNVSGDCDKSNIDDDDDEDRSDDDVSSSKSNNERRASIDINEEKLAACALTVGVGSFSDPEEIPGLAHFLEHMLFMGSNKYPKENEFDSYISTHGGSDNAETECEYTTYYFDIPEVHLEGALDRFTNFFNAPVMSRDAISREREAIESEFKLHLTSDSSRAEQLFCSTAPLENPAHKFMWGNMITLQQNVTEDELYTQLRKFWERYYSAHRMTVALQARLPMESLVEWVAKYFGAIKNNDSPTVTFPYFDPPFNMDLFNKLYTIMPIKDKNKLLITWALPAVHDKYKSRPLGYLSYIIGHEGQGSLLGKLQENLWALRVEAGNSSNGIENNSMYSLFTVDIILTESGLSNIDTVINLLFSYIKLIQSTGPLESIFKEIQQSELNDFRFAQEGDPTDYVESLSQAMQIFPSVDYITGDNLVIDFEPQIIIDYLSLLTPERANIMVQSKIVAENVQLDKTEKWFNTKYNMSDIPDEWLSRWKNVEIDPDFHMPLPNQYIPTNFEILLPPVEQSEYPELISKDERIETWFKQDIKYMLPNAFVKIYMISPTITLMPQNTVMTDMFVSLFQLVVAKEFYPATIAGLGYHLGIGETGLVLTVNGFNEKLRLLLENLLKNLTGLMNNVSEGLFTAVKDEAQKSYYNRLLKLSTLSTDLRLSILCKPHWTLPVRLEVLPEITLKKLQEFSSQLFENLYIKCLIQGNINRDEANKITKSILGTINYLPLLKDCYPYILVRKLPIGEKILRVQSFNEEDPNCNTTNYYQCGINKIEEYCKVDILMMIMQEPLFDTLRTQEQLGYDINCETRVTHGILGFSITVKSQVDKFKVDHVENRITAFLQTMKNDINKMSTKDFNQVKESLKIIKQQADLDLKSEVKRNWAEIISNEYMFDRNRKEVKSIDTLRRAEVANYFSRLIKETKKGNKYPTLLKLSVQVDSNKETDGSAELLQKPLTYSSTSIKEKIYSSHEIKIKIPTDESQSKFISDIDSFKAGLYFYPTSKQK